METGKRILEKAKELFFRHGIRTVRVEDISQNLGISKKTFYIQFPNKASLVQSLTKDNLDCHERDFSDICDRSENAVSEIIQMMAHLGKMFSEMNPNLFYDLQKYYPESWKLFLKFKESFILECIEKNLKRGIKEGFYREKLPVKIISRMRVELVSLAFNPTVFSPLKYNLKDVQVAMLEHFLYGIVTLKGHRLINKYLQTQEDE